MKFKKAIFICGHIKTGTSLMASLLDGHTELNVFPEEMFLFSKYSQFRKKKYYTYENFFQIFFNDPQIQRLFKEKDEGLFGNVDYSNFDAKTFKERCISIKKDHKFNKDSIAYAFEIIFNAFKQPNDNKNIPVEKTPMNELNFDFWFHHYPESKFIYMERNPLEVYSSIKKKRKKEANKYTIYNFILNYYKSNNLASKKSKQYPDHFKIIRLDDLKSNTKNTMQEVCNFLNIDYQNVMNKTTKLGSEWYGNSMYSKTNKSEIIKDENINREKTLSQLELSLINYFLIERRRINPVFEFIFLKNDIKRYLKFKYINLKF